MHDVLNLGTREYAHLSWTALLGLAWATPITTPDAGTWCTRGEAVGAALVERVEVHPEFERCWLRAEDGGMVAEIVATSPGHAGQCEGGGHTLFPRPELVEGAVGRIPLEPLCERLQVQVPAATTQAPPRSGPVLLAASLALAGLGWLLRRELGAFAARLVLGAAAPLILTTPALFNGGDAGYEKLLVGLGESRAAGWGPGYALWMRPAVRLLGAVPEAVFTTNLLFAAVWPALLGAIGARLGGRRVGWAVTVAAAFLPTHLTMAWSEAMHVSAVTWGTLAVLGGTAAAGAGMDAAIGTVVALGAAVAATATRADLATVAPVVGLATLAAGGRAAWRRAAALTGAALLAVSPWVTTSSGALDPGGALTAGNVFAALAPHFGEPAASSGYLVALHAGLTPWVWAVLGAGAALAAWRGHPGARAAAGLGVGWSLLAGLPFLLKVEPAPDPIRLQAFAQGGLVLIVAVGAARVGWSGWVLLLAGLALGPAPSGPAWLHREEWRFFAEVAPTLPPGTVVKLEGDRPHREAVIAVLDTLGPARWTPSPEGRVDLLYRGPAPAPPGGAADGAAPGGTEADPGPGAAGPALQRRVEAIDVDRATPERRWSLILQAPAR